MPYPDYDNVKKQLGYGIQTESKDNAIKAINQLQAKVAELEEENARLRTVPMKYRRMQFNSQMQDENNELRAQLAAAQELIAVLRKDAETYGPEKIAIQKQAWLEADRQRQINDLKDQLAKAEQLWQVAQGRCDGLEEKLAKAEQRVAEAIVDMLQQKHRNCFGAHSFYIAASVATANGEWRKFVKEE